MTSDLQDDAHSIWYWRSPTGDVETQTVYSRAWGMPSVPPFRSLPGRRIAIGKPGALTPRTPRRRSPSPRRSSRSGSNWIRHPRVRDGQSRNPARTPRCIFSAPRHVQWRRPATPPYAHRLPPCRSSAPAAPRMRSSGWSRRNESPLPGYLMKQEILLERHRLGAQRPGTTWDIAGWGSSKPSVNRTRVPRTSHDFALFCA